MPEKMIKELVCRDKQYVENTVFEVNTEICSPCAMLVGDCSATLIGGNNAKLAEGYNSIIVGDHGSAAKGKKGSIIVLVERDSNLNIVDFKAMQVDGEKIKEDVLYKLENGELIQV